MYSLRVDQHIQRRLSPRPNAKCMNPDEIEEMKKKLKIELATDSSVEESVYHPPPIRRKNCMYFSFVKT